jgi:8-oxo-dGTP diphosphatase
MRRIFKYGLAFVKNNQLLVCRPFAFDDYILPGGIKEGEETFLEGLQREIKEELGDLAELDPESVEYFGNFEDLAAGKKDVTVEIALYLGTVNGEIKASDEIKELIWFSPSDNRNLLSAIIRNKIFPALEERGILQRL